MSLAEATAELASKSRLAQHFKEIDQGIIADNKKQLDALIPLLHLTDQKLQIALEKAELAEIRCSMLNEELLQTKQALDSFRLAAASVGTNPVHTHVGQRGHCNANVQTDLTFETLNSVDRKMDEMQVQLIAALQDSAASRAAFLGLQNTSSESFRNEKERSRQEWSQTIAELNQVLFFYSFI